MCNSLPATPEMQINLCPHETESLTGILSSHEHTNINFNASSSAEYTDAEREEGGGGGSSSF